MDRKIVKIGNSYGIVLPQYMLKLSGFEKTKKLNVKIERNRIILTPLLK